MASVTKRVGARVAEVRGRRSMTQEALAKAAKVNRVTIARLELGEHPPRLDTLDRIARALDVTLVDLVR